MAKRQWRMTDFINKSAALRNIASDTSESASVPDEPPPVDTNKKTKIGPQLPAVPERKFQSDWSNTFQWLIYDRSDSSPGQVGMKCGTCIDSKLKLGNPFVSQNGCNNMRTSTLTRHESSADHKRAATALKMKDSMSIAIQKSFSEKDSVMIKLLQTVYYIAKEELALQKYETMTDLIELVGCDLSAIQSGYRSRKTAEGLLSAISETIDSNVSKEIAESEFLSVSCDETTDISNTGKLILYVKVIDDKLDTKSYFVGDYDITDKTANAITDKLMDCFNEAGIDIQKTMALGSDGASTMTGVRNGVGVQLRRQNPYMLQFHCAAHKLALCTSQAAEKVALMKKYKDTLQSIYYYFKGSHNRSDKLKAIQTILDSPQLKIKEIHDVRWFAFYDALRVVFQCWEALAQTFNAAADPKAKGLYKAITCYSFVAMSHFLMDIIPVVTALNMKFQREDLDISMIGPSVSLTVHEIDVMSENSPSLNQLNEQITVVDGKSTLKGIALTVNQKEKASFLTASTEFSSKLKENLNARFPTETLTLTTATDILAMRGLPFVPKQDLATYGNEKLGVLLEHYGAAKTVEHTDSTETVIPPVIDTKATEDEWKLLKQIMKDSSNYSSNNLTTLWQYLNAAHGKDLPNLVKLAKLVLIIPLQTATCERGFSVQNCTKTVTRNRLREDNLRALMNVKINGPPITKFDFQSALAIWKTAKERRLYAK